MIWRWCPVQGPGEPTTPLHSALSVIVFKILFHAQVTFVILGLLNKAYTKLHDAIFYLLSYLYLDSWGALSTIIQSLIDSWPIRES